MEVIKTFQEKDRETGLATNVWNVLVEVDSEDEVPDRMRWSFAGMQGGVLVNMVGRPPKCLRCLQRGHIKFQCRRRLKMENGGKTVNIGSNGSSFCTRVGWLRTIAVN